MKVTITHARVEVTCRFKREGSVLAGTITSQGEGVDVRVFVDSPDPDDRVALAVRNAEAGCFVMQTIQRPTPTTLSLQLNGQAMALPE